MTHIAGNNVDEMSRVIHEISTGKGFKEPDLTNLPEKLMLSVSELAEALEEHRAGRPLVWFEEGTGKPEGILVEIGDSVIRNLHMMHSILEKSNLPYSVSDVLNMKVSFNSDREAMHGKAY